MWPSIHTSYEDRAGVFAKGCSFPGWWLYPQKCGQRTEVGAETLLKTWASGTLENISPAFPAHPFLRYQWVIRPPLHVISNVGVMCRHPIQLPTPTYPVPYETLCGIPPHVLLPLQRVTCHCQRSPRGPQSISHVQSISDSPGKQLSIS